MSATFSLEPVNTLTDTQRQCLAALELTREQMLFSGSIEHALAALDEQLPAYARGFAAISAGTPVGFFLLKRPPLSPSWVAADACSLHALQIDLSMQGRGFGRACLQALPHLVRTLWPEVRVILLAVDTHNEAAQKLYLQESWMDAGQAYPGRIGLERRLSLAL
jgi:GNAT superfamily N-acetyltransferase